MPETPDPGTPEDDGQDDQPLPPEDTIDYWKERSRRWERQAKRNQQNLATFKQSVEDESKTEVQRLTDRITAAEAAAAQARLDAARYRVGAGAGLPEQWIARLAGSTEEELAADAAELAKSLGPQAPVRTNTKPLASLSLGSTAPEDEEPVDNNEALRQMFTTRTGQ